MATSHTQPAGRWFTRVLWLGIAANLVLAIPTLLMPERMIALTHVPEVTPVLWLQFAGLLLILLSLLYMPAGVDPDRYRAVAWLAVVCRFAGLIFFVGFQAAQYHMFGYFDLVFGAPEAVLLMMMGPAPSGRVV